MKKLDYLIIGQGIAGTLLAHFLLKKGKLIKVVDQVNPYASSRVAAGIFNPITGRRFVKTWKADEIFPFAEKTYQKLEEKLDQQFYFSKKIIRTLSDQAELREWELKSSKAEYAQYIDPQIVTGVPGKVEILKGGHVDLPIFINAFRKLFIKQNILLEDEFNHDELKFIRGGVTWKDYYSTKVIFCEGFKALQNPWFNHLPFTHAKGEILTIHSKTLKGDNILSKGIFVLPLGNDNFKVGSTYDWDDLTENPTGKAKQELIEKLSKLIGSDYTIIDHQAGIRPTVKDRRPLIGLHSDYPSLGIFNGLGTKGVSLGPYFADQFVQHLEENKPLNKEVVLTRFSKK